MGNERKIDHMLASALRSEAALWPNDWNRSAEAARVVGRIAYHGIAGLIADRAQHLEKWPDAVLHPVRTQAIALAMWELRHKAVLEILLSAFADEKIVALLLKGTALAYDLYPSAATRARGDSDLLVAPTDLNAARSILAQLGYRCQPLDGGVADDLTLQEVWSQTWDGGTEHHIDLHWQLLNAPSLRGVLKFSHCASRPIALPRLSADALSMNRVLTLAHTCIHRAMHITSPYFVDGVTYYGGDRLIWANDIHLLAGALSAAEWRDFISLASTQGVAAVCLNGLKTAQRSLATRIPDLVSQALGAVGPEPASAYLLDSHQMGRAWKDLLAIRGWRRKLAYLRSRALPSRAFVRGKYPAMARMPLGLLYACRMVDLIRTRPGQSKI